MGKQAKIKQQRKLERLEKKRQEEQKDANILLELLDRCEEYEKEFKKEFGKLDEEGDFEASENKSKYIIDRIEFWQHKRDYYDSIIKDKITEVDIKDAGILEDMIKKLYDMAKHHDLLGSDEFNQFYLEMNDND